MKQPLTKHWCLVCNWELKSHKSLDGLKCPSCNGPTDSKFINNK